MAGKCQLANDFCRTTHVISVAALPTTVISTRNAQCHRQFLGGLASSGQMIFVPESIYQLLLRYLLHWLGLEIAMPLPLSGRCSLMESQSPSGQGAPLDQPRAAPLHQ